MTKGEALQLARDMKRILWGITFTDAEDKSGWWETSEGAEFGKKKLGEIVELINDMARE